MARPDKEVDAVNPKRLTRGEFHATFTKSDAAGPRGGGAPVRLLAYFDAIPEADFEGFDGSEGVVSRAWQTSGGRYQHVLVNTQDQNVFMVLVLLLPNGVVYGHRLLDLNEEYGLSN